MQCRTWSLEEQVYCLSKTNSFWKGIQPLRQRRSLELHWEEYCNSRGKICVGFEMDETCVNFRRRGRTFFSAKSLAVKHMSCTIKWSSFINDLTLSLVNTRLEAKKTLIRSQLGVSQASVRQYLCTWFRSLTFSGVRRIEVIENLKI